MNTIVLVLFVNSSYAPGDLYGIFKKEGVEEEDKLSHSTFHFKKKSKFSFFEVGGF